MKPLLLCLLLFIVGSTRAQTSAKPFKGANTILVQLPDSGVAAWKAAAKVLLSKGYTIKNSDKELLTLSTESKSISRAGDVILSSNVSAHQVVFRGIFNTHTLNDVPMQIVMRGMVGSPFMIAWNELEVVAASLGGTITYAKQ
ncbi:hypothetical protein [Hymenobacter terrenus]|uniref:hypothetical protein n=1 Tax=Hymenobacter terrenus TaxID=1629124 RepID=UPI000619A559|nr:hypothetical protein [Hymenobacter terrenus]